MRRVKIAAVSYLNTIPFIYGIEHSGILRHADLNLFPPADCARSISSGEADIALIPIAEIPYIENIKIIGNHCISARDVVRTVGLLSASPVEKISKIYLDPHSRTSVKLVKILADELWNVVPEWLELDDYATVLPEEGVGYVLIGDKVFNFEDTFQYKYDLAHEWRSMTGLPFVFAAWVANNNVRSEFTELLEAALKSGVENIRSAVESDGRINEKTAYRYLTKNIDFLLDEDKRNSMKLFFEKLKKLKPDKNRMHHGSSFGKPSI